MTGFLSAATQGNKDDDPTFAIRPAGKRRFLPFFITQLLGAFNDNIFKQSLILAILYHLSVSGDRSLLVNLCALLFILPFFLFSALGGQFGEKYNKDALMRALKLAEVGIMLVGAAGFVFGSLPLMFVALFAMGTHSALFGPVKYSILPQHLRGRTGRRQRAGGDGHLPGDPGRHHRRRRADVPCALRGGGGHRGGAGGRLRLPGQPRHSASGGGAAGVEARLEHLRPVLEHPPPGARPAPGGLALAGGQLLVLVPRRGLPDADPDLRQGMAARRRKRGDPDPHRVLGGHRAGLDAVRSFPVARWRSAWCRSARSA